MMHRSLGMKLDNYLAIKTYHLEGPSMLTLFTLAGTIVPSPPQLPLCRKPRCLYTYLI